MKGNIFNLLKSMTSSSVEHLKTFADSSVQNLKSWSDSSMDYLRSWNWERLGYSHKTKEYFSSGQCPQCKEAIAPYVYTFDGERKLLKTALFYSYINPKKLVKLDPLLDPLSEYEFMGCPLCHSKWKIKSILPEILEVKETNIIEEDLGTELIDIDNSKSSATCLRKFTMSKKWSKDYLIEYEKTKISKTETSNELKIEGISLGGEKEVFEDTIRKKYTISGQNEEIFTDEVQINVPAHTKLTLAFDWKKIWQCGYIKFLVHNKESIVPFQVCIKITFDQRQVDEHN